jgi:serine/threonine protein kinase
MRDDPLIGRRIGNYSIERLLGRGGMASVYYGWDIKLARPVAVKVIDVRAGESQAYAERFVREARAVATWRHENIIQVYYADEQDGLYYYAMEYIDGLDLGELLAQYAADGELMADEDVLLVARAVAQALDYAHQQGVIHRDVKPSNVMVTREGRVVLTDFGLAMDAYQGSMGQVFGTAQYISPEQARSSAQAVPQSDLYAFGVMLYEMLTGARPFDDPSAAVVALQHITEPPRPPRELNPRLSDAVQDVLLKALSKSPQERYQSAAALVGALEAALEPAQEPSSPERTYPEAGPAPSHLSIAEKLSLSSASREKPAFSESPTRADESLIGVQLDEYRIEVLLGKGGMASIYRGLDVRLQRRVAIKVISAPLRADPEYMERFQREAQAIARLEHPHIVRLYRYGEAKGLLYMAMQYVDGSDLASVLRSYRKAGSLMEPQEAARIVREVCLALDDAHAQGVIHRDVKPSNIMLDKHGYVCLADFGLALLTELGTRGEILGSPRYVAPEQAISSANVVPQSDLYAVGVILYEMFTGELPFDAQDPMDLALLHMNQPPRPPRDLRPEISPGLEAVILKALAKDPADRYQSGVALADALDRALDVGSAQVGETIAHLPSWDQAMRPASTRPPVPIPVAIASPDSPPAKEAAVQSVLPRARRGFMLLIVAIPLCALLGTLAVGALAARQLLDNGELRLFAGGAATQTAVASVVTSTATLEPRATATVTLPPLRTPTPGTPTAIATSTPAPTRTGTPTRTHTPVPTATPMSTLTPTATSAPAATYELQIVGHREDSLFIVNQTALDFPLPPLRVGDGEGALYGAEWGILDLAQGQCVSAWKEGGKPKAPKGLKCDEVGEKVTRDGPSRFWDEPFKLYYAGELVGTCEASPDNCTISIPH